MKPSEFLLVLLSAAGIHQSCSWLSNSNVLTFLRNHQGLDWSQRVLTMDDEDADALPLTDISDTDDDSPTDEELESNLGEWDERVATFNSIHIVGRVGNNPEPRFLDDGNVVVNLSLACRRKIHYMERQTEEIKSGEEETDWFALEIWGQTAEFVSKYVQKGTRVGVVGSLQLDDWEDQEVGERRYKAKCIVQDIEILETKAEAELRRSNQRGSSFYTTDDEDEYDSSRGSAGGFFD
mmetsp:Transcript_26153/g.75475  ORF Transcript_26153/g.75475 Transcript_26153/m.75475 type:complete len:237 (-) Transcript_26153:328-1038(-)